MIRAHGATIAVVGLGYVGTPLAALLANVGFNVSGIDKDPHKVRDIGNGHSPLIGIEPGLSELLQQAVSQRRLQTGTDFSACEAADVIMLAVDTPIDGKTKLPDESSLRRAARDIAGSLRRECLVVVESTTSPGTVHRVVRQELEGRGKRLGTDFWLASCPERVMPGRLLANMRACSRVIGAADDASGVLAVALYRHFVDGELDVTDIMTAELVKTAENAYRDVQIAFANEMALLCEELGVDVMRVRDLVNKSPYRQMHIPGGGVGGHCIPKDPWLLVASASSRESMRLITTAREINDAMPAHVADLVAAALARTEVEVRGSTAAVLGYAYLENSGDTRNSPSQALCSELAVRGIRTRIHDPFVAEYAGPLDDVVDGADVAVFMVRHEAYAELQPSHLARLLRTPNVVDARGVFRAEDVISAGLSYQAVGAPLRTPRAWEST